MQKCGLRPRNISCCSDWRREQTEQHMRFYQRPFTKIYVAIKVASPRSCSRPVARGPVLFFFVFDQSNPLWRVLVPVETSRAGYVHLCSTLF